MTSTRRSTDELKMLALAAAGGTDHALVHSPFARALAEAGTAQERPMILRAIVAWALERNGPRIDDMNYPEAVRRLVRSEFAKIRTGLDEVAYDFGSHEHRSQLRIACLGRIPVGPEHFEIDGLPRSLLYRGGALQACQFLRLLGEMATLRPAPLYILHLAYGIPAAAFLLHYTPEAQRQMFHRLAGCLRMNPGVKGIAAGSWWFDASIRTHSQHLSYLRDGWEERGARFFFYQATESERRMATVNSPRRRRLVSEGHYRPSCYIAVWPRASLLDWAEGDLSR